MNASQLVAALASVLSALNGTNGCPDSILCLAMGGDLERWGCVKSAGLALGWISSKGYWCRLTPEGEKKAAQIDALLSK